MIPLGETDCWVLLVLWFYFSGESHITIYTYSSISINLTFFKAKLKKLFLNKNAETHALSSF